MAYLQIRLFPRRGGQASLKRNFIDQNALNAFICLLKHLICQEFNKCSFSWTYSWPECFLKMNSYRRVARHLSLGVKISKNIRQMSMNTYSRQNINPKNVSSIIASNFWDVFYKTDDPKEDVYEGCSSLVKFENDVIQLY